MRHQYNTALTWTGNLGIGTASYSGYSRDYTVSISGKPDLPGSADPGFRGSGQRHNPEDLLVAALSGCHMLAYLALCARRGVTVIAYEDHATGSLNLDRSGGAAFEEVTLSPIVTITAESDRKRALELHDVAHHECFIANSCRMPVRVIPTVHVESAEGH